MYLDIRLIGKENEHINNQVIYSGVTNLSHFQYNKHEPLQSAIDERAFADESHIALLLHFFSPQLHCQVKLPEERITKFCWNEM